jgi:hypothetical protein
MALETLKDVKEIGGFVVKRVEWEQPQDNFIEINDKHNAITFKIQNQPIKIAGINGCQVDTIIETAKIIIEELNRRFPCRENSIAITKLDECLMWLNKRKADREKRNVEGTNNL